MKTIPLRQAEMLSYLQGCGPVGEWVAPLTADIAKDLNIARPLVCQFVKALVKRGFIQIAYIGERRREYRVLIRLERPDVQIIDHGHRTAEARKVMRQKALAREARRRAERNAPRPKIRWAGFDKWEAAAW